MWFEVDIASECYYADCQCFDMVISAGNSGAVGCGMRLGRLP